MSAFSTGRRRLLLFLVVLVLGLPIVAARELSLEDRVKAQEAIERVRYAHQEGATLPFEQAVPKDLLRHKVENDLAQSAALESIWGVPVTAVMLERELTRIAARTRMPTRLTELFVALDNDPLLIQECLIRPVLVDRLARSRFGSDRTIHAEALARASELRDELLAGTLDPGDEHPSRKVTELRLVSQGDAALDEELSSAGVIELEANQFERWRGSAPKQVGEIGPVVDQDGAYVLSVILEEGEGHATVASYTFPKRAWDEWWPEVSGSLDPSAVRALARDVPLPALGAESAPCAGDLWETGVLADVPGDPRSAHSAVWTGSEMIVWGGERPWNGNYNTGARYDPATDSWAPTSTVGAPSARTGHAAAWTGQFMVVWGGTFSGASGGRYDPRSDTWTPTSLVGAPQNRRFPTAVWTGEDAIFWGGYTSSGCNCCDGGGSVGCNDATCESTVCAIDPFCCDTDWDSLCNEKAEGLCSCCPGAVKTGGRYDPVNDTWSPTSLINAPSGRLNHSAVWTGAKMVVWGGGGGNPLSDGPKVNTGGRYDPLIDAWVPTTTTGAPSARSGHTAVGHGHEMIVWGGSTPVLVSSGARYDVETDTWTPTTLTGAPAARYQHTAVWPGHEMIVWGGQGVAQGLASGGRYNPVSDSWLPTSTAGAPTPRMQHTMVWTGSEAIVWGGVFEFDSGFERYDTGGRYDPATDSWTPTFTSGTPQGTHDHTAVWTGNEMIVWGGGGCCQSYSLPPVGGRYDPALDAWTPTATQGAPSGRANHTAVWTGDRMIVWGGLAPAVSPAIVSNTGGRYNPIADTWSTTAATGAPAARWRHSAVWTGTRMIVWGGYDLDPADEHAPPPTFFSSGALYNPVANQWKPTSSVAPPTGRTGHSAIWTGSKMIVWGGADSLGYRNDGESYDPVANTWVPTSATGAPAARAGHTAVWTGDRMVVWGGADAGGHLNSGARYDPATGAWSPTSDSGAPPARSYHTAIWTGARMVVWGGIGEPEYDYQGTGGNYDPVVDSWIPTSMVNAPVARANHTAVWTGDHMIVWGGQGNASGEFLLSSGGSYLADGVDSDGDGAGCVVDCDDASAGVVASPGEVSGLGFGADNIELQWDSASAQAGSATLYDVVRGSLVELPVGNGGSEVCLASDYGAGSDPVLLDDTETPGSGDGFWYIVRATNSCGIGSYGTTSANEERVTTICP